MKFFERKAIARIQKRMTTLESEEEILDFEVGFRADAERRERIDLVATDQALHVHNAATGEISRVPYEHIDAIIDPGPLFHNVVTIKLLNRAGFMVQLSRGRRDGVRIAIKKVEELVLHRHEELLPNQEAPSVFELRPIERGGEPVWLHSHPSGIDLENPQVRGQVESILDRLEQQIDGNIT